MYSKSAIVAAAAMASLAPAAFAQNDTGGGGGAGNAIINNHCSDDIYVWSIDATAHAKQHIIASGESYSEPYRINPNGGGISLKMSLNEEHDEISQFEYTLVDPKVFYDLSNVDGYPFAEGGISIEPSDSSCTTISCDAGEPNCKEAYNEPYDDWATHGCSSDTDLVLELCPGISPSPSSSSGASSTFETSATTATASPVVRKRGFNYGPYGTGNITDVYSTSGPTASPSNVRHPHYRHY